MHVTLEHQGNSTAENEYTKLTFHASDKDEIKHLFAVFTTVKDLKKPFELDLKLKE